MLDILDRELLAELGISSVTSPEGVPLLQLPGQEVHNYISGRAVVGPGGIKKITAKQELERMQTRWRRALKDEGLPAAQKLARQDLSVQTKQRVEDGPHTLHSGHLEARRAHQLRVETESGTRFSANNLLDEVYAKPTSGYFVRPGTSGQYDEGTGQETLGTRREPMRLFPMETLTRAAGIVQRGGQYLFGAAASKLPKQVQQIARERVSIEGLPRAQESTVLGQTAVRPEQGQVAQTRITFGGPAPPGMGYYRAAESLATPVNRRTAGERGRYPVGERVERIKIAPEDVQFFQPGAVGRGHRVGLHEQAVGFSIGRAQHLSDVPQNWNWMWLKEAEIKNAGTESPEARLVWGLSGGDWSAKGMGLKQYLGEARFGRGESTTLTPEGAMPDIMVGDPKNWRMIAGAVFGTMTPDVIGQHATAAGVDISSPQWQGSLEPHRSGQKLRWGSEIDPMMQQTWMHYASQRLRTEEMQFNVHPSVAYPYMLGAREAEGVELTPEQRAIAAPWVLGIERHKSGMYQVRQNVSFLDVPMLQQPRREWQYGKTRLNVEEYAEYARQFPNMTDELLERGRVMREPWAQAIKMGRFLQEDIPASRLRSKDALGMNWGAALSQAAADMGTIDPHAIPTAQIPKAAAEGWREYAGDASLNTMARFDTEKGARYMMSPEAMMHLQSARGLGEEVSPLSVAYWRAFRAGQGISEMGSAGEQPFHDLYAKYVEESLKFSSLPGVMNRALSVPLPGRMATEGTFFGSKVLGPGEFSMGRRRWEAMFPEMLEGDAGDQARRWDALQGLMSSSNVLATGHRRPTSDWGQMGMLGMAVSPAEMAARGDPLTMEGNELVLSEYAAAVQRGDFDADRFLQIVRSFVGFDEEGMPFQRNVREAAGQLGVWDPNERRYREDTGIANRVGQKVVGKLMSGFNAVAPGSTRGAVERLQTSLAGKRIRRELRRAGATESGIRSKMGMWAGAYHGGTKSNELRKGAEDARKTALDPLGQMRESFGASFTAREGYEATSGDAVAKQMMGVSYNSLLRDLGPRVAGHYGQDARRGLAEAYQVPLDRETLSLGMRMLISARTMWKATGKYDPETGERQKQAYGYFPTHLSEAERAQHKYSKGAMIPYHALGGYVTSWLEGVEEWSPEFIAQSVTTAGGSYDAALEYLKERPEGTTLAKVIPKKELYESPMMRMILESAHEEVYDRRGLGATIQEKLSPIGEATRRAGQVAKSVIAAVKAKGTVEPRERASTLETALESPTATSKLKGGLESTLMQIGGRSTEQAVAPEDVVSRYRQEAGGSKVPGAKPGTFAGDVEQALEKRYMYVTPSELSGGGGKDEAYLNILNAVEKLKGRGTVLPEGEQSTRGSAIHGLLQKWVGMSGSQVQGQDYWSADEEIFHSEAFRSKFGHKLVGKLDFPGPGEVWPEGGREKLGLKEGEDPIIDIKAVKGISQAETLEEYLEMVESKVASSPYFRRQFSSYHYGKPDSTGLGIVAYDPDIADDVKKYGSREAAWNAAAESTKAQLAKWGLARVPEKSWLLPEGDMQSLVHQTVSARQDPNIKERAVEYAQNVFQGLRGKVDPKGKTWPQLKASLLATRKRTKGEEEFRLLRQGGKSEQEIEDYRRLSSREEKDRILASVRQPATDEWESVPEGLADPSAETRLNVGAGPGGVVEQRARQTATSTPGLVPPAQSGMPAEWFNDPGFALAYTEWQLGREQMYQKYGSDWETLGGMEGRGGRDPQEVADVRGQHTLAANFAREASRMQSGGQGPSQGGGPPGGGSSGRRPSSGIGPSRGGWYGKAAETPGQGRGRGSGPRDPSGPVPSVGSESGRMGTQMFIPGQRPEDIEPGQVVRSTIDIEQSREHLSVNARPQSTAGIPQAVTDQARMYKELAETAGGFKDRLTAATETVEKFNAKLARGERLGIRERVALSEAAQEIGRTMPQSQNITGWMGKQRRRFQNRWSSLQQGDPGQRETYGLFRGNESFGWELEALNQRAKDAQVALQAAGPDAGITRGGKLERLQGTFENFLSEFSIGGAAIRLGVVQRMTTGRVQEWEQQGQQLMQERLATQMAYGAPYEQAMQGQAGTFMQYGAMQRSFAMGRGQSALQQRAGMYGIFAQLAGSQDPYEAGQRVGQIGGPVLAGLGTGLSAGIIGSTAGKLLGSLSPALGMAVGGAAPYAAAIAGIGAAAYRQLGADYESGSMGNLRQEYAEMAMGQRDSYSRPAERGVVLRNLLDKGYAERAEEGLLEYSKTASFQIDKASIYLRSMETLQGLDPAQREQLMPLLRMAGATPEGIQAGDFDELAQRLAPIAMFDQAPQHFQNVQQLAGSFGIAPGNERFQQMLTQMPTPGDFVSVSNWMQAGQQVAPYAMMTEDMSYLERMPQYAEMVRTMTPWQFERQMRQETGITGFEGTYGYASKPGVGRQAEFAAGADDLPGWLVEAVGEEMGRLPGAYNLPLGPREQATRGTQITQAIKVGTPEMGGRTVEEMLSVLTGGEQQWKPGYGVPPDVALQREKDREMAMETPTYMRQVMGAAFGAAQQGAWGFAPYSPEAGEWGKRLYGVGTFPGPGGGLGGMYEEMQAEQELSPLSQRFGWDQRTQQLRTAQYRQDRRELGRDRAQRIQVAQDGMGALTTLLGEDWASIEQRYLREEDEPTFDRRVRMAQALKPIAEMNNWTTMVEEDYLNEMMRMRGEIGAGATTQAMRARYGGDSMLGRAFGLPGGLGGWEEAQLLEQGMTQTQMQQMSGMVGFGMSRQGFDMMSGGWGFGPQMGEMFDQLAARGIGPGAPPMGFNQTVQMQVPGAAAGTMGIYGKHEMEQRDWGQKMLSANQENMMRPIKRQLETIIPELEKFRTNIRGINEQIFEAQHAQQARGIQHSMASLKMSTRHQLESLALQERMFHTRTAFQRQEFGFQEEQMQTQFQWKREDMALGRQISGFQFEFQQGELDRAIRLAGGREKGRLMRQRDYQETMFSFGEQQRGTQQERFETQAEWQEDRFDREKAHFEEMTALQQEQFDMQRRHIMERYALEMAYLQEQMDHLGHMKKLQEDKRKAEQKWEDQQLEWKKEDLKHTKSYYEDLLFPYQEKQREWQISISDAAAVYANWQLSVYDVLGTAITEMINKILGSMEAEYGIELAPITYPGHGVAPVEKPSYDKAPADVETPQEGGTGIQSGPMILEIDGEQMEGWLHGANERLAEQQSGAENWKVHE